LGLAVDLQVDLLVEEGDPAADGQGVVARLQVGPGDVLVQAGVVRRLSASTTPSRVARTCRELGTASTRW
jgi:hypothetical protein